MNNQRIPFAALDQCNYYAARLEERKIRTMLHGVADGTVEPEAVMSELRLDIKYGTVAYGQIIYVTAHELIERHAETGIVDNRLRDALIRMHLETAKICDKADPGGQVDYERRRGNDRWLSLQQTSERAKGLAASYRKRAEKIRATTSDDDLLRALKQMPTCLISE